MMEGSNFQFVTGLEKDWDDRKKNGALTAFPAVLREWLAWDRYICEATVEPYHAPCPCSPRSGHAGHGTQRCFPEEPTLFQLRGKAGNGETDSVLEPAMRFFPCFS